MRTHALIVDESLVQKLYQQLYRCLEDVGSTKAALYLTVPGTHQFHLVAHYGWPRAVQPPASLEPEHPLLRLLQRERRGLVVNDALDCPELEAFGLGSPHPRFFVSPIYDRGEWIGLLLQRDPRMGDSYRRDRQEGPTQTICQAMAEALRTFPIPPFGAETVQEIQEPVDTPQAALRVHAPHSGAMVQVEERIPWPEGEALERFALPHPAPAALGIRDTQDLGGLVQDSTPSESDTLFPEQRTYFWEAANLLCQMVPTTAIALFIRDDLESRPVLTYSRLPLGSDLKAQILTHFLAQVPQLPGQELRLLTKAEWPEREPLSGTFLTLLPVLLEEQVGDDDLLLLFRQDDQPFTVDQQNLIRQVSRMLGFHIQEGKLHERYHQAFLSVSRRILASAQGRVPSIPTQSLNTASLCRDLARKLGLPSPEVEAVSISAILHDVGTLLLDTRILAKPRLTPGDMEQVKTHPILASTFLKDLAFPFDILGTIRHHHEHWDGSGYPDGIRGEAIPLGSRIIHLVEAFEVMTAGTTYKPAKGVKEALAEIKRLSGKEFDPAMVQEFVQLIQTRNFAQDKGGTLPGSRTTGTQTR